MYLLTPAKKKNLLFLRVELSGGEEDPAGLSLKSIELIHLKSEPLPFQVYQHLSVDFNDEICSQSSLGTLIPLYGPHYYLQLPHKVLVFLHFSPVLFGFLTIVQF